LVSNKGSFYAYSQDTNFWGAVHGTLYAIPHLKNSKGRIIVIASYTGWFPLPRLSFYNVKLEITNSFQNYRDSTCHQFNFNFLSNYYFLFSSSLVVRISPLKMNKWGVQTPTLTYKI
jgi:NAD(P)-dependent dehydrogenase (short-subunit alcohol dehydrogenase family)